ncbi:MAG: hypothetical protein HYV07_05545 [Deltaproteobacteria bacterium]|nr:hypothetical protein [Deltaproteobacteria bacterium]
MAIQPTGSPATTPGVVQKSDATRSKLPNAVTYDTRTGSFLPTTTATRVVEAYPDQGLQLAYRDVQYVKLIDGSGKGLPVRREDCNWLEKGFWKPPVAAYGSYREFFFLNRANDLVGEKQRQDPRLVHQTPEAYAEHLQQLKKWSVW